MAHGLLPASPLNGSFVSMVVIGAAMSTSSLKDAPAIETPLFWRPIVATTLHRVALLLILALQAIAVAACRVGAYQLVICGELTAATLA
jgi:hypothetical protein